MAVRKFDGVVIVRLEVSMNNRLGVVCVGFVNMFGRNACRRHEPLHEGQRDGCTRQRIHAGIMSHAASDGQTWRQGTRSCALWVRVVDVGVGIRVKDDVQRDDTRDGQAGEKPARSRSGAWTLRRRQLVALRACSVDDVVGSRRLFLVLPVPWPITMLV